MKWVIIALIYVQNVMVGFLLLPFVSLAIILGLFFCVCERLKGVKGC